MYTLREIQEVTKMLQPSSELVSLRTVLNRELGTLRFGRSLRLLDRINHAAVRDIVERLAVARDSTALVRVLADAAQECELASARTEFMLVPNEDDLGYLLDDIAQFGALNIATMIIILAVVRYPKTEDQTQPNGKREEEAIHGK
jgi:hypothetical protein